jgi:hypothetical protein
MNNQQTFVAYVTGKRSGRGRYIVKADHAAEAREVFEARGFAIRRIRSVQQELFCKLGVVVACASVSGLAIASQLGVL